MQKIQPKPGLDDICRSIRNIDLPFYLAWSDIRQRYRRSTLGPFWITLSMGVMIGSMGIIFSNVFKAPMREFFPFITAGLILWNFISGVLNESCYAFISAEPIIKQLPIPLFSHILRVVVRNFYIFLHNLVIFPLVCLFVGRDIGINDLLFIPGLIILIFNLLWMSLILAVICSRYRDIAQIIQNILQIALYVTPIIWMPNMIPGRMESMVLGPNPFFHLIEIVRSPLMNELPTAQNWIISLLLIIFGWLPALALYNRFKSKIAYWL